MKFEVLYLKWKINIFFFISCWNNKSKFIIADFIMPKSDIKWYKVIKKIQKCKLWSFMSYSSLSSNSESEVNSSSLFSIAWIICVASSLIYLVFLDVMIKMTTFTKKIFSPGTELSHHKLQFAIVISKSAMKL